MPVPSTVAPPTPTAAFQVEIRPESARIFVRARELGGVNQKLTPAGIAAALATISAYYSSLTAAQATMLAGLAGDQWVNAHAAEVAAAVLPADMATVAATLTGNVRAAGATVRG